MNCPNCKAYNPSNANFCSQCGAAMQVEGETQSSEEQGLAPGDRPYDPPLPHAGAEVGGELIPRDIGGLVSETFAVYSRGFGVLWRIALVANIPFLIGGFLSNDALVASLSLAGLFTGLLANGATAYAVSQQYLGRKVSAGTCYVAALNNAVSLLMAAIAFFLAWAGAAILSFLLIGIPLLIYISATYFFYVPAIMIEGQRPIAALARSAELVRGSWWRVFGIGIVFVILLLVGLFIASIPGFLMVLISEPLGNLLLNMGAVFFTPIGLVGTTLVYLDLRVRKEGYTLETLASEIG